MTRKLTRRDFLKLAGLGMGALAFTPKFRDVHNERLYTPKRLPQFPAGEFIGRVCDTSTLRSKPTDDLILNTAIGEVAPDTLIEWNREVIGKVTNGLTNQKFVETPQGYIYTSRVQQTRNLPNTPVTEMPAGFPGFWAEVTVPYVDLTLETAPISPWIQSLIQFNFPPRLYYGQVVWIDQVRNVNGFVEYRWNESPGRGYGFGDIYWLDGAGVKFLTEEEVAPISPSIDPNEKRIIADINYQTISCFEGNTEVYFCKMSSGAVIDALGNRSEERATPVGELFTHWKIVSLNMSGGGSAAGYSTPAVPWSTVISGEGIAIHGAFWHNDFGAKRSHGCLNVRPDEAKWIFRWTTPYISLAQSEARMSLPDHGTIVTTKELKLPGT